MEWSNETPTENSSSELKSYNLVQKKYFFPVQMSNELDINKTDVFHSCYYISDLAKAARNMSRDFDCKLIHIDYVSYFGTLADS